jgi:hypothetical protein
MHRDTLELQCATLPILATRLAKSTIAPIALKSTTATVRVLALFGLLGVQAEISDPEVHVSELAFFLWQTKQGSITQMDVQIGRLRTMLASKGVAQNTMLWFSSDK